MFPTAVENENQCRFQGPVYFKTHFRALFPVKMESPLRALRAFPSIRYQKGKLNVLKNIIFRSMAFANCLWILKDILSLRHDRSKNKLVSENVLIRVNWRCSLRIMEYRLNSPFKCPKPHSGFIYFLLLTYCTLRSCGSFRADTSVATESVHTLLPCATFVVACITFIDICIKQTNNYFTLFDFISFASII